MPAISKVCLKMTTLLERVFQVTNSTHLKDYKKLSLNISSLIGGSFDLMENNLKEEGITVHSLLRKSFMSMVEKILELDILIIYGALTFLV
jgi:hypothetical protein